MRRNDRIVPVLMFHSAGLQNHPWVWSHISEPVDRIEEKLTLLRERGFGTAFWAELHEHMAGRRTLPPDTLMLTFDDGYLDNWVFVYPLLKKLGMRATIFVNPEFVDPRDVLRPSLDDVWQGRCGLTDLQPAGFLSWPEMRAMEASGLVDIQSHALTHTWYFTGPRVVGFHAPTPVPQQPWLFWNQRPDRKPFYLTEDQQGFLPWGHPIFEHEKALVARRFFPDPDVAGEICGFVAERGGSLFFEDPSWRDTLRQRFPSRLGNGRFPGGYETEVEQVERVTHELAASKILLETHLDKRVDFLCWPGGGVNPTAVSIAGKVGYKAWTLSSRDQGAKRNAPHTDPTAVKRLGSSTTVRFRGKYGHAEGGAPLLLLKVLAHQSSWLHSVLLRTYMLQRLCRPGRKA